MNLVYDNEMFFDRITAGCGFVSSMHSHVLPTYMAIYHIQISPHLCVNLTLVVLGRLVKWQHDFY